MIPLFKSHVLPGQVSHDAVHLRSADAEAFCECFPVDTQRVLSPDLLNISHREPRLRMRRAARACFGASSRGMVATNGIAALGVAVAGVIGRSAQEEMCRLNTTRTVAAMTHVQAVADRSEGEFIGNSVHQLSAAVPQHNPVPPALALGAPNQAFGIPLSNTENPILDWQQPAPRTFIHPANCTALVSTA